MQHPDRVDGSLLPEPVDAADALLEAQRIPRQLEIDHQPAAMMEAEAFARGICGREHIEGAGVERINVAASLIERHAAVNRSHSMDRAQRIDDGSESVAVF